MRHQYCNTCEEKYRTKTKRRDGSGILVSRYHWKFQCMENSTERTKKNKSTLTNKPNSLYLFHERQDEKQEETHTEEGNLGGCQEMVNN